MYLITLEICVLKYRSLILQNIFSAPGLTLQAVLKRTKVKLHLSTDTDLLLMVGKGTRGGICHSVYRYARANNKYIKNYNKNKESSYIQYWNVNNLYGLAMPQKLPVSNFEWIKDTSQTKLKRIFSRSGCSLSSKIT